jgi:putative transposase
VEGSLDVPASHLLSELSDAERALALERFQVIRLFLEEGVPLSRIARDQAIPLRTAQRWVSRYRAAGLTGLARKARDDKNRPRLLPSLQEIIEGLALQKPRPSIATVHRKAIEAAAKLGTRPPSYSLVYALICKLDPALLTMAHEGTKSYSDRFDLIHRREAEGPNSIWQADHTELDILVKDGEGQPRKPWLTIVLDDFSRAVAAYLLSFLNPLELIV